MHCQLRPAHLQGLSAPACWSGDAWRSRLWLIDLAGSKRVSKTEATGERLKEAQFINKSLRQASSVLGGLRSRVLQGQPRLSCSASSFRHLLLHLTVYVPVFCAAPLEIASMPWQPRAAMFHTETRS
jgi:hypothetical protein